MLGILAKNETNKYMILMCILKCIINNCKPPQSFEFSETELPCRFICFEKFPWVC